METGRTGTIGGIIFQAGASLYKNTADLQFLCRTDRERKRVLQYYDDEGMENSVWQKCHQSILQCSRLTERGAAYNETKKSSSTMEKNA